jgi:hypothetical protein
MQQKGGRLNNEETDEIGDEDSSLKTFRMLSKRVRSTAEIGTQAVAGKRVSGKTFCKDTRILFYMSSIKFV